MSLFDLIIFGLIGYGAYQWFKKSSKSNEVDENLTETQRHWREVKAQGLLNFKDPLSIGSTNNLDYMSDMDLLILAMKEANEKKEPFVVTNWLMWAIDHKLANKFIMTIGLQTIVFFSITLFMLGGINTMSIIVWAALMIGFDAYYYHQQRFLKVSWWNDDWMEKYGDRINRILNNK